MRNDWFIDDCYFDPNPQGTIDGYEMQGNIVTVGDGYALSLVRSRPRKLTR